MTSSEELPEKVSCPEDFPLCDLYVEENTDAGPIVIFWNMVVGVESGVSMQ